MGWRDNPEAIYDTRIYRTLRGRDRALPALA